MKHKKHLNEVIRKIQRQNNCKRTDALNRLSGTYSLSYVTLWSIAKHGRVLKRKKTVQVLHQIFKDYLDIPIPKKPGPMQVSGRR